MTFRQYAKVLYDLTHDAPNEALDEVMGVYIRYLQAEGALKKIDRIIAAFEAYALEQSGTKTVQVKTVHDVSEDVVAKIQSVFGKNTIIQKKQDPSLLGGIVVRSGDTIFDGSVRTQLDQMKQELAAS